MFQEGINTSVFENDLDIFNTCMVKYGILEIHNALTYGEEHPKAFHYTTCSIDLRNRTSKKFTTPVPLYPEPKSRIFESK